MAHSIMDGVGVGDLEKKASGNDLDLATSQALYKSTQQPRTTTTDDADADAAAQLSLERSGDLLTSLERTRLKPGLAQRHVSMIALAGAIGTGLFLSLGGAIATGGPLGALLAYTFVGLIVCAVQFALGEVTALLPTTGSFVRHAEVLVDPALGFAVGWNIVYGNALSIPSEISAICVLFTYWTSLNSSVFIAVFIVATAAVALSHIRWYGEIEFFFASIKILLVVGLIIFGLVVDLGGVAGVDRIGFRYWRDPGPFVPDIATGAWGSFLGFWAVLINAVFSFAGVESIAMAAAETQNPRKTIPKACKRVFARVTLFYVLSVLVVGMLVRSDDPAIVGDSGTAADSPFVVAAEAAGIAAIPSIVNAVVITSAFSSSNQALLAGTRVLYGLAIKRQAPAIFLRTTSWGVPYVAVSLFILASFLSFMSLSNGALTVFYWFVDLVGCGVLISWSAVLVNHLRLMAALKRQGIAKSELPWSHRWTPYTSLLALVFCVILLLTNGFSVFTKGGWDPASFVTAYLDIPLILVAWGGWKLYKRTKVVSLDEIPLRAILAQIQEEELERSKEERDEDGRSKGWLRFVSWLWD